MANWVFPDIHGCSKTFRSLVEKIGPSKEDAFYFLGDYVDRGPDSKGVIDFIVRLKSEGFPVFPIMGNHEEVLLRLRKEKPGFLRKMFKSTTGLEKDWRYFGGEATLLSFQASFLSDIPKEYWQWIETLPLFIETSHYYLVHAGFNFEKKDFLLDKKAMLWTRKFTPDARLLKGKKILHGHVPIVLNKIMMMADDPHSLKIGLDNGCVYKNIPGLGNLLAFEMDSGKILVEPNMDF